MNYCLGFVFCCFTVQHEGDKQFWGFSAAIPLLPVYQTVSRSLFPLTALLKVYLTPYKELLDEGVFWERQTVEERQTEMSALWILISLAVFQGFRSARLRQINDFCCGSHKHKSENHVWFSPLNTALPLCHSRSACQAYLMQTAVQTHWTGDGAGWWLLLKSQPLPVSFEDFKRTFESLASGSVS